MLTIGFNNMNLSTLNPALAVISNKQPPAFNGKYFTDYLTDIYLV